MSLTSSSRPLVTLVLLLGSAAAAPDVHVARFGVADGLPVDGVSDVLVGRDGRLWVATWDGLVRYDGARFHEVAADGPWPSRRVVQIREDRDGGVWAQVEPDAFVKVGPDDALTVVPVPAATTAAPMAVDATGRWLVATDGGVLRLEDDAARPFAPERLVDLATDRAGRTWGVDAAGQISVLTGDAFVHAPIPPLPGAWRLAPDGDTLWVGGRPGIWRVEGEDVEALTADGAPWAPEVRGLARHGDALWVGTKEGLVRWRDGALQAFEDDTRTPRQRFAELADDGRSWVAGGGSVRVDGRVALVLDGGRISDIEVDRAGAAWVGSTVGLYRLLPPRITVWSDGLTEANAYAAAVDGDGAWWVGTTASGVDRVGPDGAARFGPEQGVDSDVSAILVARDASVWLGTRLDGVLRQEGDRFVAAGGPERGVRALVQAPDGRILAGAADGLWAWDGAWTRVAGTPQAVQAVALDGDALWLGTAGEGLWRVDAAGARPVPVRSRLVRGVLPDGSGGAWAATEDAGLQHTDGRALGTADGLPARGAHALLRAGDGAVWGSSNRGLFRIAGLESASPSIAVFAEPDGLLNAEANGGTGHAALRLADGRLAFTTQAGIAVVDPAQIEASRRAPEVVASAIVVDDARISGGGPLVLAPDQRTFEVELGVLGVRAPERARLRWRLEGLDDAWVRGGERRTAYYRAVPPGSYTLRVAAVAADGTPAARDLALDIEVLPWFYETMAFRVGVALGAVALVAGAVAGAFWWRLIVLRRREIELRALVDARTAALAAEKAALEQARETVAAQAARLAEVDRLKTRYFANLSHELRTPLTLLLGPLEDVREGRRGAVAPEAQAALLRAERSAKGLFALVNQLLDVVKIDAGQLRLQRASVDLVGLVQAAFAAFEPLAERRGIALQAHLPSAPIAVDLDAREFGKVLGNLLSNAVKFTPPGGSVDVVVEAGDGGVQVAVRDTGPGISAEGLERIFDRFYVVDGIESGLQPGTGLGLALAREIVELHGGELGVDSTPGRGSTFTVRLPTSASAPAPAPDAFPVAPPSWSPDPDPTVDDAPDERTTVLVADDHAELRRYIAECLEPRYRVVQATDGLDALRLARRVLPDLVVSDLMMPGMDGHDLVRALRADPELGATPVVLLTARAGADDQVEALSRGADVYLTKPFSSAVLRAQVDALFANRARLAPEAPAPAEDEESVDARYERAVRELIAERHVNPDFGVQELADAMHQDRAHLFRRIKAITGATPSDLIRLERLNHAARLLARRSGNVSEVAYASGFASLSYFSRAFRDHFGIAPSKYQAEAPDRSGD